MTSYCVITSRMFPTVSPRTWPDNNDINLTEVAFYLRPFFAFLIKWILLTSKTTIRFVAATLMMPRSSKEKQNIPFGFMHLFWAIIAISEKSALHV